MPKSATLSNPKPGEIPLKDFLAPMKLSQNGLARAVSAPPRRIKEIVFGNRAITADTDLRLARYFGLSDGFWLGIQSDYETHGKPDQRRIGAHRATRDAA